MTGETVLVADDDEAIRALLRFVEQAKILGVDCLVKPFFADQLLESAARTLERSSAANVA
jgi:CheY-like chemotaxis protein